MTFGFTWSLILETLQLIFKVGSFDVDDLFLNTLGAAFGFGCYCFGTAVTLQEENTLRQIGNKVSYVKNPLAKNSFYCLGLGIVSPSFRCLKYVFSVRNAGQGGLNTGAYGFSSMAAAIMGLWYGILSFTEDDCNYILARIGMALEGIILLIWVIIIFTGIFR